MVKFTIEQLHSIMSNQNNIRNMSVIAHVDHGKSTLTDSLIAKAGIISENEAGTKRITDGRQDEIERGITIKSTGISLYYEYCVDENKKEEKFLINLIDSPGHVDFSSEVTAALRVTDGALVVVDYVEGVCVQTETVLRQSLQELIQPILMINKVDRAFCELRHDEETIYQNFMRVIENVNVVISTYQNSELMRDLQVDPIHGNVAFGSAYQGWGFTLNTFAKIYGEKFQIEKNKILKKLWGEHYYNEKTKKWSSTKDSDENDLVRGFCSLVLKPIKKLIDSINDGKKEVYLNLVEKLNINLTKEEKEKSGKEVIKIIMRKWLNVSDVLLEMIILHLPSPKVAQKYRTQYLYEGNLDDEAAKAMINCDPEGPVMMFVSKMVPSSDGGRFYAFGRVFSGTVSQGQKVRILGPNYKQGKNEDLFEKNIQRIVIMMAKKEENVANIPCGNTCGLVGIDQCLVKQGTVTTYPSASKIKSMSYSVSPVVKIAVKTKNPADLPKLVEGLKKMSKADPLVQVITTDTENIICGSGELHLEICIKDLCEIYAKGLEIIQSEPIVPYKETVTSISSQTCLSKSPNKHNRLFVTAEPLNEDLVKEIDLGTINASDDLKIISRKLIETYSWDIHDAKKLWVFGPDQSGPNFLVDQTKAVQYLNEIRDSMESAFQDVTNSGILAEESLRGVRFNILDVELHPDAIHRGAGQIIPTARNVYLASELTAQPRFMEPVYICDISTPSDVINGVYQCFNQRRGVIFLEENVAGTPLINVKGYLPVSESFGFSKHLRSLTSGQAFPQCNFSHWDIINMDPFDSKSKAYEILMAIRKRKGIKMELPVLNDYIDKI